MAQQPKETANIFLGTNYGLKRIHKDSFVLDTTYRLAVTEITGTLNAENGKLLLYTNQDEIKDSNHKLVSPNGIFKGQNSAMQGAFFYQHPDRPYIDYFTNMGGSANIPGQGIYHHYIEYSSDTIIPHSMNNLLQDSTNEAMGIMRSPNGKDLWILSLRYWSDSFFAYYLDEDGLCPCPKRTKGNFNNKSIFGAVGKIRFNSSGSSFIIKNPPYRHFTGTLTLTQLYLCLTFKMDILKINLLYLMNTLKRDIV